MNTERKRRIGLFAALGERLEHFGRDERSERAIRQAMTDNAWFSRKDILQAVRAVREQMLGYRTLSEWLAPYPAPATPKRVGIVMAGNIPLVGFFDLLCVLVSGHEALIKPSSKDTALMNYVVGLLREMAPGLPVRPLDDRLPDAVIATGSDNTNRYFRSRYGAIPSILRGNRASAGVLSGRETEGQLQGLASDIFSYSGLGCRNVSHLLVPPGYDLARLTHTLSAHRPIHEKYRRNFTQRAAVLTLQGAPFLAGDFFLLREAGEFPAAVSEITYHTCRDTDEALQWLKDNDRGLQCVVGDSLPHPRAAAFGQAQSPRLTDYPDALDVPAFLASL